MPNLTLEKVSYKYKNGDRKAVDEVSCVFKENRINAVVGPSGSGKTTLLSIMAGLDRPSEGDLFIGDESLRSIDLDLYRREKITMIFQGFIYFQC